LIGTLRYIVQRLSKNDSSFTIDVLIDEIVTLEEKLNRNEKAVNELNVRNKQLQEQNARLINALEFYSWDKEI
jgi:CII-binding regulator of phage lambda lysogenization HflD